MINQNVIRPILFLLFLVGISPSFSQDIREDLLGKWKNVYEYEAENLPRSANGVIDSIYSIAKANKNRHHLLKAIIYKVKFINLLEENGQDLVISTLQEEIKNHTGLEHAVLCSYLANTYKQYLDNNAWNIRDRNNSNDQKEDYKTWSITELNNEIERLFLKSLENKIILRNTPVDSVDYLLIRQENSSLFRPTLYDFLGHELIDFYTSSSYYLPKQFKDFDLASSTYLKRSISELTGDITKKYTYKAVMVMEELATFHESRRDTAAFLDVYIDRINILTKYAAYEDAEDRALEIFTALKKRFQNSEHSTLLDYEIAKIHYGEGKSYPKNEKNQFKLKQAREICLKAEKQFPNAIGTKKCGAILNDIGAPFLRINSEMFVPSNQYSKLLVSYKNVEEVQLKIYKSDTFIDTLKLMQKYVIKLSESTPFYEKTFVLPSENDYQNHQTEISVPPLNNGLYVAIVSSGASQEAMSFGYMKVTNIAMISLEDNIFQLVNRRNGKPLDKAEVNIYANKVSVQPIAKRKTDRYGRFTFSGESNNNRFSIVAHHQGDNMHIGQFYQWSYNDADYNDKNESVIVKPIGFTDRSIYRPGQTVYFKGILLKIIGEERQVVPNEWVEVYLEDPNYDDVGEYLTLKTNEFGSFSGEYKLPKSGMSGEYTLYIEEGTDEPSELYDEEMDEFDYVEIPVSVEEYKRPRFEVTMDKADTTFILNDSITVSGKAMSFAGSPITNASFKYTVSRATNYPEWYYWDYRRRSGDNVEIAIGSGVTNTDGSFNITFPSLPDIQSNKEDLPIFNYQINVDVTDINGETRSGQTSVNCGYHKYKLNILGPEKLVINKDNTFSVKTKNLNDHFVPAKVKLTLYKVTNHGRIVRERPWPAPDRPIIPKSRFIKQFPHESFSTIDKWSKGEVVFETAINTAYIDSIVFNRSHKINPGNYILEALIEGNGPVPIKEQKRLSFENVKSKKAADYSLFNIELPESSYQPGDQLKAKVSTAADDLYVTVVLDVPGQPLQYRFISVGSGSSEVKFNLPNTLINDAKIHYSYVFENTHQHSYLFIPISMKPTGLVINTETFRDNIRPGEEETWSFSIENKNDKDVSSELLASMYDESLDSFKEHDWQTPSIGKRHYSSKSNFRSFASFENSLFRNLNLPFKYRPVYNQGYDKLFWFGFSFTNPENAQRHYAQTLAMYMDRSHIDQRYSSHVGEGMINGTIENEHGETLPGVNVIVKGSSNGTTSDANGYYVLKAEKGDEIEFSFVGYSSKKITIGDYNIIDVKLQEDMQELQEVVVVGYGEALRKDLTESADSFSAYEDAQGSLAGKVAGISWTPGNSATIQIRGNSSISGKAAPLYIVDGVIFEGAAEFDQIDIAGIEVLKGESATALYGARAANGVIIISTKSGQEALAKEMAAVKARTDFSETAFFKPHITVSPENLYKFTFHTPESLTRWKLQLLAHDKAGNFGKKTLRTISQKELMVLPNPPRFIRQGDKITLLTKIANLTKEQLSGQVTLLLFDPITGKSVDQAFENNVQTKDFIVKPKGNNNVSWKITVPNDYDALEYKIVAKTGTFSDGESNVIPILSNRDLITETLPVWANAGEERSFEMKELTTSSSNTLHHHQLTFEMTENPVWYVIKSLPYLMEFPHECAEQTFSRYFANILGQHILTSNTVIAETLKTWESEGIEMSKLNQNETLKNILLEETPWIRDAESEEEQQQRIATLLDITRMKSEQEVTINNLFNMQLSSGGFPWFAGGNPSRHISQHIVSGFGHLKALGVSNWSKWDNWSEKAVIKGVGYVSSQLLIDFNKLKRDASDQKDSSKYMSNKHIWYSQLQGLYSLSFFNDEWEANTDEKLAINYYLDQARKYWKVFDIHQQAIIAIVLFRNGNNEVAHNIVRSLKESSIQSDEMGNYWRSNIWGWHWYQAPVETQALLIELFNTVIPDEKVFIDKMKVWLLRNKQTNSWPTTKSTTKAIYAMLQNSDLRAMEKGAVDVKVGEFDVKPTEKQAGSGYYKMKWAPEEINNVMSKVQIKNGKSNTVWGALYWQYFEDLDKVASSSSSWAITKDMFKKVNTQNGPLLKAISDSSKLEVGDLVTVRLILKIDRAVEFVHLKDQRAAGLEPVDVISAYKWQDGLGYYQSTRDTGTHFFFDSVRKGTYVFEYDLRVNNSGDFSNGIARVQSMYAPEFSGHSEGIRLKVE